jgi:sialate O-acetylesterase
MRRVPFLRLVFFRVVFLAASLGMLAPAGASPGRAQAEAVAHPLLHPLFSAHAVLQRDRPLAVWGWAEAGATVSVQLDAGLPHSVRADPAGRWRLALPPLAAGGPHRLTARTGARTQTVSDLLAGDVYLCSGQSNMELQTRYATNAYTVLDEADSDQLRLFDVSRRVASAPQETLAATDGWALADAQSVGDFSAVCYFFGRNLQRSQGVPIGLIHPSWGGTPVEAWMSEGAFRTLGGYEAQLALAALAARDPAAAGARFAQMLQQWWSVNDPGGRAGWQAVDLDDRDWGTLAPGGPWEDAGEPDLASFDGIAWYRTELTLTAAQAALGGRLALGPADDVDITYLNGQVIGGVSGWDTPRDYAVRPGALRVGRNVLAAAVLDTGGDGGFWGPAAGRVLHLSDGTRVPLTQRWRYRISAPLDQTAAPPQPSWGGPNAYSALYNSMIAPLGPYGLRGVLWYQGESNAGAPEEYGRLLPGLFADWRRHFESPELEIYVVQLASYGPPVVDAPTRFSWGRIRDVQRRVVIADPHAGLVVSVDVGDRHDIHPTQKQVVGDRLARLARHRIYGEEIETSGPAPQAAVRSGDTVTVSFTHGPLRLYSGHRAIAFELCAADRACRFVDASVEGGTRVRLAGARASDAFVRFCWGDGPICNLFNDDGLPAVPCELAIETR